MIETPSLLSLILSPRDISTDAPIQTLSTGLFFIIVPIKNLSTLQRLTVAPQKAYDYLTARSYPDSLISITSRVTLATLRSVCVQGGYSPPAKTPLLALPRDARRLGWCGTES